MANTTKKTANKAFTDEERAAMKTRAREEKEAASREEGEKACIAAIAAMQEQDRAMGERIHAIITSSAPTLAPKTWYGMPAYASDSKIVCFFQPSQKFKTRYSTLGFNDSANLDEGGMWPVAFALKNLTPAAEAKIAELVKKAVS